MHLLTIALHFSIQYYLTAFQMLIVIAMPEMFQQCLQERDVERVLHENLWCNCEQVPVVIDNELVKKKAHNFVCWNWLMIGHLGQRRWGGLFGGGALAMFQKIRKKCLKIYETYSNGTVEEFGMFTLIYSNRSQHAFGFQGNFKGIVQ